MIRTIAGIISLCIMITVFTGCYDRREVDDMTYVIAMGLDKGQVNNLRLTLQFALPLNIGGSSGGGGGGGGEGGKSVTELTLECPTLISGLNMANNFVGKQINIAHAKIAVFSEELAREGRIFGYIIGMSRNREFRPNMVIAVSRGPAMDYIKSIKPVQEADPAKYYEFKFSAYRFTGFAADTVLYNFYSMGISPSQQSVATLVGVSDNEKVEDFLMDKTTAAQKGHLKPLEGDYMAGELPKVGDIQGEAMGLAAFNGSKMVGEMDGEDASYYLMMTGNYKYAFWTLPDPKAPGWNVVLNVQQRRTPDIKIDFTDGKPRIKINVFLEGDYMAIQSGNDYESDDERRLFEDKAKDAFKEGMLRFLNKTSKEYGSDICGFGRYAKYKFLTWDEWLNFEWLKKYKDADFDLNLDFKIRRPGLMIRTSPLNKP